MKKNPTCLSTRSRHRPVFSGNVSSLMHSYMSEPRNSPPTDVPSLYPVFFHLAIRLARMEALLPLTKIPCILLATIGLQITATPPHPPPAKSEEAPSTSWEVVVKQRGGPVVIKASLTLDMLNIRSNRSDLVAFCSSSVGSLPWQKYYSSVRRPWDIKRSRRVF